MACTTRVAMGGSRGERGECMGDCMRSHSPFADRKVNGEKTCIHLSASRPSTSRRSGRPFHKGMAALAPLHRPAPTAVEGVTCNTLEGEGRDVSSTAFGCAVRSFKPGCLGVVSFKPGSLRAVCQAALRLCGRHVHMTGQSGFIMHRRFSSPCHQPARCVALWREPLRP